MLCHAKISSNHCVVSVACLIACCSRIASMIPEARRDTRSMSRADGMLSTSGRKSTLWSVKCLRFEIGRP